MEYKRFKPRITTKPLHNAEYAWVFEGIEEDVIGNFGLCGAGAAGFELDRADQQLGTLDNTVALASSKAHSDDFILVLEKMLTHLTTLPGPAAQKLVRADMVWFDVPTCVESYLGRFYITL